MRNFYSFYVDAFVIALQSILAHKLRAFLTLIGIIIGVASVVVVGASINGLNSYVVERIAKVLGMNHFAIARIAVVGNVTQEQWERMDKRNKVLAWNDYEWVMKHCGKCEEVGASISTRIDLKQQGQELYGTQIIGDTASMAQIENKTMAEGRFLLPHEVERASMVAVLGQDVKEKFFLGADPLGKTIRIQDVPMTVVGVEEKRGSMFGQSMDNMVYIPISTFSRMFGRRRSIQIHGKAQSRELFPAAIDEGRNALRIRHKLKFHDDDDFGLVNVEEVNNEVDQFTGAIAAVVTPITLISLIVGGIVVMNIMLVSVTERTFEIGLRKAIGARRSHILLQFLIESSLLSSVGGVIGLLLAAVLSAVIRATTPIPMTITFLYVFLSVAVSGGIGILAGIYPAFKAARLDPIIALAKI